MRTCVYRLNWNLKSILFLWTQSDLASARKWSQFVFYKYSTSTFRRQLRHIRIWNLGLQLYYSFFMVFTIRCQLLSNSIGFHWNYPFSYKAVRSDNYYYWTSVVFSHLSKDYNRREVNSFSVVRCWWRRIVKKRTRVEVNSLSHVYQAMLQLTTQEGGGADVN